MALSTADTNKWSTLIETGKWGPKSIKNSFEYERTGPIRQRQRRLSAEQAAMMADRYREGATVYELAKEFNVDRRTVSDRLKKTGVRMRLQPPPSNMIEEMVRMYVSGLSLAAIGKRLRMSPQTIRYYVNESGVQIRHER